jgi:trimeric autotransporter adhesin
LRGGYGRSYLPSNTGYNANGLVYGPTPFSAAVNPIPFGLSPAGVPVGTFDQPSNTYVVQPAGAVQSPSNYGTTGGVDTFNRYLYKTGHTDQWNFFIERQFSSTWLVNAGYVGSRSALLPWRQFQLNGNWSVPATQLAAFRSAWIASNGVTDPAAAQVPNPLPALIGHAAGASGGATITAIQSYMPYLAALGETNYESRGSSAYNAFVAKVQHSTSHGLMLGANYTWSKATGLVGGANNQTYEENQEVNSSGPTGGVDWVNLKNNHSLLDFDVSNRFVLNGSYSLPFGKGKAFASPNAFVEQLIGGWQITSAIVLQGGNPWAPICSSTLNGRCNQVPGQPLLLPKSQQRYYNGVEQLTLPDGHVITPAVNTFMKWNPDAWSAPMITMANGKVFTDQYQNGTTPIAFGFMRTPGVENVNLSVIKRFPITERVAADFHVNATNALNHHNPYAVNNTITPITATTGANGAAPGQNSNVSFGSYGLTALENRQMTIQANITF